MGVVSSLSVIKEAVLRRVGQFGSTKHDEACPLSGIKKVRLWEVVYVYLD